MTGPWLIDWMIDKGRARKIINNARLCLWALDPTFTHHSHHRQRNGSKRMFLNLIWVLRTLFESYLGVESVIKWILWLPLPTSLQQCIVFFYFLSFDHSIKSKTRPICVKILMPLHYGKFQGITRQIHHMLGRTLHCGAWRVTVIRHERWHHTSWHSKSWDNITSLAIFLASESSHFTHQLKISGMWGIISEGVKHPILWGKSLFESKCHLITD